MNSGKAIGGVDPSKLERIKKGIKSINVTGETVNKKYKEGMDILLLLKKKKNLKKQE